MIAIQSIHWTSIARRLRFCAQTLAKQSAIHLIKTWFDFKPNEYILSELSFKHIYSICDNYIVFIGIHKYIDRFSSDSVVIWVGKTCAHNRLSIRSDSEEHYQWIRLSIQCNALQYICLQTFITFVFQYNTI